MNKLTIITVVYNAKADLELTLRSIRSQGAEVDVVVVDGGSKDGTLEVIKTNSDLVKTFVSEPDRGIYDAMNKGIDLASGEYIYFLNAGDVFFEDTTLRNILLQLATTDADVLYGDVVISGKITFQLNCDVSKLVVHHQGIVYRKNLHAQVGKYLVSRKLTIADYLFFNLIVDFKWQKASFIMALCDGSGVSSKIRSYYSKVCVDFLFGRLTISKLTLFTIAYPFYKALKTVINFKSLHAK